MDIDTIRKEIDRLDNELLRIFNRRAALALDIGAASSSQASHSSSTTCTNSSAR